MTSSIVVGFATTNSNKLCETTACLQQFDPAISVVSLVPPQAVEETGKTFSENAHLKLQAALLSPLPEGVTHVIAEDSGLIVDALDGTCGFSPFPGVYSDRWLSASLQEVLLGQVFEKLTFHQKNQALLHLMRNKTSRQGRYEAVVAVYSMSNGQTDEYTGTVKLWVSEAAIGENGFGYDPIMIPIDYDATRTMAQLSSDEKNRISHRFMALTQIFSILHPVSNA